MLWHALVVLDVVREPMMTMPGMMALATKGEFSITLPISKYSYPNRRRLPYADFLPSMPHGPIISNITVHHFTRLQNETMNSPDVEQPTAVWTI